MNFKKLASALLVSLLLVSAAIPAVSALTPYGTGILMRNWLKNDPNYQFSEAYKTSVWYENFTSLELTENDRNNILRIAVSQLGYHEGDSPEDFHGGNTSGTDNYIEYARLLVPNWNNNSYDWCACFVNWCLNQARFDKASSEISCRNWVSELTAMGMYQKSQAHGGSYTPRPADFIFFNWDRKSAPANHIGFVLYATDTHVYTIEGNSSNDNVTIRSYALNDSRVIGYGTPPYHEGSEPTLNYAYEDGMPQGTYVINSYDAVLMSASSGGTQLCTIPVGSAVSLRGTEGAMAHVTYGDREGYVASDILCLLTPKITLTFDANGGSTPPDLIRIGMGEFCDLTSSLPTLEGDTLLGWSTVPYNASPDFSAGEPVSAGKDTTLYAVWEKRSAQLAQTAFGEGKAPLFPRPASTQNSAAILSDALANTSFFSGDNAKVSLVSDDSTGTVLSMSVDRGDAEAFVTLDYTALTSSLLLAPVSGNTLRYAVLKVKAEMANSSSWCIAFNDREAEIISVTTLDGDWQYAAVALPAGGLGGDLTTIEFGLLTTDDTAVFLLADMFFLSTEEQVEAVTAGRYIFPVQAQLSPEPETTTETETTVEDATDTSTQPVETSTDSDNPFESSDESIPSDSTEQGGETETSPDPASGGCASALALSSLVGLTAAAAAAIVLRKKED